MTSKQIVHRVEPYHDRQDIYCTTYQMRNFYKQFNDGFFTALDVMNYIQHHQVVKLLGKNDNVLDMCCGRGLLLPMIRYYKKTISTYTGVDIKVANAEFRTKRVTDGKKVGLGYYPFAVHFVESDVAKMSKTLPHKFFDFIVYTSSIEHMHYDVGMQSLYEARKVATDEATLFLTCPNTPEDQDGYDTQYAAHVYEWKKSEVLDGLKQTGWKLKDCYGLLMNVTDIERAVKGKALENTFRRMRECIPAEWLGPIWATLFPDDAKELAYIATTN